MVRSLLASVRKPGARKTPETLDAVEVLSRFGGITPFNLVDDGSLYRRFADKFGMPARYGASLAYIVQATRGCPMKYADGSNLITFTFNKYGHDVVAVSPMGENVAPLLGEVGEHCLARNLSFCIKKIYRPEKPSGSSLMTSFYQSGFRRMRFFDPKMLEHERPDDVWPERYVNLQNYRLKHKENTQLAQKTRRVFGSGLNRARFPDFYIFSKVHNFDFVEDPEKDPLPVSFEVYKHPCQTPSEVRDDIRDFVSVWATRRAEKLSNGDSNLLWKLHTEFSDPYMVIIGNFDYFSDGRLFLVRDRSTSNIVGCIFSDRAAPGTRSIVMNLADSAIPHSGTAFLAGALSDIASMEQDIDFVNFGGSEERELDRFKRQFKPNENVRSWYLTYKPDHQ